MAWYNWIVAVTKNSTLGPFDLAAEVFHRSRKADIPCHIEAYDSGCVAYVYDKRLDLRMVVCFGCDYAETDKIKWVHYPRVDNTTAVGKIFGDILAAVYGEQIPTKESETATAQRRDW